MRRVVSVILAVLLLCAALGGCSAVGEIAGNVADAAVKELENQLKATLEKNKVEVVEVKTAFGKLNGEDEKAMQFFCAALIKCETDTIAQACVTALDVIFEETGVVQQTASQVQSQYLVHKTVSFDHTDFSNGNYYMVYAYNSSLTLEIMKGEN